MRGQSTNVGDLEPGDMTTYNGYTALIVALDREPSEFLAHEMVGISFVANSPRGIVSGVIVLSERQFISKLV